MICPDHSRAEEVIQKSLTINLRQQVEVKACMGSDTAVRRVLCVLVNNATPNGSVVTLLTLLLIGKKLPKKNLFVSSTPEKFSVLAVVWGGVGMTDAMDLEFGLGMKFGSV